jgi:hypothetical protein
MISKRQPPAAREPWASFSMSMVTVVIVEARF